MEIFLTVLFIVLFLVLLSRLIQDETPIQKKQRIELEKQRIEREKERIELEKIEVLNQLEKINLTGLERARLRKYIGGDGGESTIEEYRKAKQSGDPRDLPDNGSLQRYLKWRESFLSSQKVVGQSESQTQGFSYQVDESKLTKENSDSTPEEQARSRAEKIEKREKELLDLKKEKEIQAQNIKENADNWKARIISKCQEHRFALYDELNRLTITDPYGNTDSEEFYCIEEMVGVGIESLIVDCKLDEGFQKGIPYFWRNVILEDKNEAEPFFSGWFDYEMTYNPKTDSGDEQHWYSYFFGLINEYALTPVIAEALDSAEKRESAGFSEDMSGEDYEVYCGNILVDAGWNVEQTSATNDQGVDLFARIEEYKFCIQCKRYSNPVGNKAVQEIIAGTQFYGGTHSVVVSNAGFTKSAKELAEAAGVILISDTQLENLEDFL